MGTVTLKDKIISLLKEKDGLTDREITNAIYGIHVPQQAVNHACRLLVNKGVLKRGDRNDGLLGNYLLSEAVQEEKIPPKSINDIELISVLRKTTSKGF